MVFFLSKDKTDEISNYTNETNNDLNWYQKVQVYDMVALPQADANNFHITVNGLWNGFFD